MDGLKQQHVRIVKLAEEDKSHRGSNKRYWKKAPPEQGVGLAIIQFERSDQLKLCDGMEQIADQLPNEVDIDLYESIYSKLRHNLPIYHRNEEALFERVSKRAASSVDIPELLKCVVLEHVTHSCYADDLYEYLDALKARTELQNPSTIGFMLRFCFHSIRRHLAWEDLILMPMANSLLTEEDHNELSEIVQINRQTIGLNLV